MPTRIPPSSLPAGWFLEEHLHEDSGARVKCYTNALGQKFFNLEDLMRYVTYAERAKVSIYSEQARLVGPASQVRPKKPTERTDGTQRYRSLAEIYEQTSPMDLVPLDQNRRC